MTNFEEEQRNSRFVLGAGIVATIIGVISSAALTEYMKISFVKSMIYASGPALVGFCLIYIFGRWVMKPIKMAEDRNATDIKVVEVTHIDSKIHLNGQEVGADLESIRGTLEVLEQLGLTELTSHLSDSPFTPAACMKRTERNLAFLGVLGSKWVNEPRMRDSFEQFLRKISSRDGKVKFCLIDPSSKGFVDLKNYRDGNISVESLEHFRTLMERHENLEVRLYSNLPSFRLIFLDDKICSISRYRINKEGYFQSEFGWQAPHIAFSSEHEWSLYFPFNRNFANLWNSAKPLKSYDPMQLKLLENGQ